MNRTSIKTIFIQILFASIIIAYKYLGKINIFQEWYYLFLQWLIIWLLMEWYAYTRYEE